MEIDWITLISAILAFIAGGGIFALVTIKVQKKKLEAEIAKIKASVKSDEIENMKKALESFYGPLVDEQNKRIATQASRIAELESKVSSLEKEKRDQAKSYQVQIDELRKELNNLQTEMLSRIANALSMVPARGSDGKFVKKEAK